MPGVAIGVVTSERIADHLDAGEYRRSRSVTVRVESVLVGNFPASVQVATSCGLGYPPKDSRVVVFYPERNVYGVWEANDGFESAVLAAMANAR